MTRFAWMAFALAACATPRPASVFPAGGGTCPDPAGCSATIDHEQHYAPPDGDHGPPPGDLPPIDYPRAATCEMVGDNLASIELGNYADAGERAPVAARWAKACAKQKLDAGERLCEFDATDKQTMTWCAPRFAFGPGVPVLAASDCSGVLAQMRGAQVYETARSAYSDQLAAVEASCTADRWPVTFAQCVRNVPNPEYISSYCAGIAPVPLLNKLADRLAPIKKPKG